MSCHLHQRAVCESHVPPWSYFYYVTKLYLLIIKYQIKKTLENS